MKLAHWIRLTILVIVASGCASPIPAASKQNHFVLRHVNIVDVAERRVRRNQCIAVRNGQIVDIQADEGSQACLSEQDKWSQSIPVIDGKNGFVTPGLIDMHVHIFEPAAYLMTLSHGVTHVRIMNGVPKQLIWRDQVASGEMIGSSSTVSSPIISGYQGQILHHGVETASEAKQAVLQYHQQGYDLIKAYGSLNESALTGLIEQAAMLNMPVAKHGPHGSGDMPLEALRGLQSFEHVEDIYQGLLNYKQDHKRLKEVILALKQTAVPLTPTLNIFNQLTQLSLHKQDYLAQSQPHYTSDIVAFEANHNQVERWLNASEAMAKYNQASLKFFIHITKKLHQQGLPLLVGSDSGALLSPHGLATHSEMMLLQQAGLSVYDVLAAATINPAKALQLDEKLGEVKIGFQADFVFTRHNPTTDLSLLSQPTAVSKLGRWYTGEQLNRLRDEAIQSRSLWQEIHTLWQGW